MSKVLVLQALHSLSGDQAEFQIQDRLSFMRFLGLGLSDKGGGRQEGLAVPGTSRAAFFSVDHKNDPLACVYSALAAVIRIPRYFFD